MPILPIRPTNDIIFDLISTVRGELKVIQNKEKELYKKVSKNEMNVKPKLVELT